MKKLLLFLLLVTFSAFPQSFRLMTYNLLNYPGTDTTSRNPYFRETISYVNPDILVVQEVTSQAGVTGFLSNVLNSFGYYKAGTFIDGPDTDNAIFFKDSAFTFISNTAIGTALRNISQFKLKVKASLDTLIIYSVHLKASQGTAEEAQRAAEVDVLRNVTNNLSAGSNYFVVGDFNLYTSAEAAYQKLLSQSNSGYFLDPINRSGTWHNNSTFTSIHTQSPRVENFGGGSTGGLDDRFDFILISQAVKDEGGVEYINNSYVTVGNDGSHFNKSINVQPNTAVPVSVANALYYSSDHLPLYAEFEYDDIVPVELIAFSGTLNNNSVILSWSTVTEINNDGFEIERSVDNAAWTQIGFIKSNSNSTNLQNYSYTDANIPGGVLKYRLKITDLDGSYKYSNSYNVDIPLAFELLQNYPNPFNPSTNIKFRIAEQEFVTLKVYDIIGNEVSTLLEENKLPGEYSIKFDASDLANGVYFYTLNTGRQSVTKKMIFLK